jgi:hypothetical protein
MCDETRLTQHLQRTNWFAAQAQWWWPRIGGTACLLANHDKLSTSARKFAQHCDAVMF